MPMADSISARTGVPACRRMAVWVTCSGLFRHRQHDAAQARRLGQGGQVVGPVVRFNAVDADPGGHAGGQRLHHAFPCRGFARGGYGVFHVENDRVCFRGERRPEIRFVRRRGQQPGAGKFGGEGSGTTVSESGHTPSLMFPLPEPPTAGGIPTEASATWSVPTAPAHQAEAWSRCRRRLASTIPTTTATARSTTTAIPTGEPAVAASQASSAASPTVA